MKGAVQKVPNDVILNLFQNLFDLFSCLLAILKQVKDDVNKTFWTVIAFLSGI